MLSSGPSSLLASWNTSNHFCSWPGVVCGHQQPVRVIALRMDSFNLSGLISPFLGNLSFLKELDLHGNQLVGKIPPELGHLGGLQVLNVSLNYLQGSIPVTLQACGKLTSLDLSNNYLQGEIPSEMGTMKKLVFLNLEKNGLSGEIAQSLAGMLFIRNLALYNNRLSGNIPSSWGNLTNLHILDLSANMLLGGIPSSFGMLYSLSWLDLSQNNLSGLIPDSLWNISSLTTKLSVRENFLTGTITQNKFDKIPHLQKLYMDNNQFHGPIPASICNASGIMEHQLDNNFFDGIVPPEVGRLGALDWLQLNSNSLKAKEPKDWDFLSALTNCSQLQALQFSNNKFGGFLPRSLSNLSASLTTLILDGNTISGNIPEDIGHIPKYFGYLTMLYYLNLSFNNLGGEMPDFGVFANTSKSNKWVRSNQFSGLGVIWAVYKGELTGEDVESTNLLLLESWLHQDANDHQAEQRYLNLYDRVTILLDVAYALDYLHCHGLEPVVHCDLKSSNVLLDADMVAHVGDFGPAKILVERSSSLQQSTSSMGLRGTIGYAAPG
ncbi:hypothetical protein HU200_054124 [Digitaria exilis]|uniref:Protein kinase domain-containing protein n=1 Tax=Digitaria exilis TaxID=1010633 RepID=A0A835AQZ4_9POAL|nr:hypothetical protein HU200_054124 [Digitaria exilis]